MDLDDSDCYSCENSPAPSMSPSPIAKPKGKAAAKSKMSAPLAPSQSHNVQAGRGGLHDGKAIEEIYQKKSQLEHILLRPDTYIGSTEKQQQTMWVHDGQRMVQQTVGFVPGLYKIFDEILVNAADNKVRDPTMDTVKVDIDVANGMIKVWNNGDGIPVEMHKEEGVYVPELIFGHLLTSSNYDDSQKKITGGRNGYGAKLANIFSTEFVIETCDGKRQRRYRQVFKDNMSKKGDPKLTSCKATDNWTCVSFKPDLAKFGMEELESDTVALMRKRVYDLAGILPKGCKVYLDGVRLPIKTFNDYVDLYLGPKENGVVRVYERINERWEVCISMTDGQHSQVSFVNSICTTKGGTHVNYVVDQLTKSLVEKINKKHKTANVKPFMVKNHLWVFVNANIENPAFDSQTKENLTLRASSFGSKCDVTGAFADKVAKCGVVENILSFATFKNNKELKKSDGTKRARLTGIPKLDDANDAGGRGSSECTLILTEGDSAKTLAISGLSVVGRDKYGVFPLRGKLLNVREASAAQISGNTEIQNIKQILGLQHGKVYTDAKSLRYGHLMIMTDQDHDGSHIKGLIMNFLHSFFPSLLKLPTFLLEFITPIVKATKGSRTLTFYTMPEYEAWKETLPSGTTRGWSIKYYKGLGTSTPKEAKEYFAALESHRKEFTWEGDQDGEAIEMAFSKKAIEQRKHWLSSFEPGTFLDNSADKIPYADFINKELILFSRADLERSIPCMVDGLKPGQRKILYSAFKRNLKTDIKVAQLAGYVAEHSAYHHGEASLSSTIVGLAQDFVGSNNINLLFPSGQFGTRLQGGKDAASARYIYTRLAPLTRHLFNENDDRLLEYQNEEGQNIEPKWYIPIVPTVLINGAEGIGTGWSTSIPNFNPRDIVDNIRRLMAGEEQVAMTPWYRGFNGSIQEVAARGAAKSYVCNGIISQLSDTKLEITELPIRKWTQDYKEFLEALIKPEDKNEAPCLNDYHEHHTDATVHFTLDVVSAQRLADMQAAGLESKLKMQTKFSTGNMMLFNASGVIQHYQSAEHIIQEFFTMRLDYYERRRQALLKAAQNDLCRLSNRVRFITAVIEGTLKVSNRKKAEVEADLALQGFDRLTNARAGKAKGTGPAAAPESAEEQEDSEQAAVHVSYDYLLSMPIYSLTWEKVEALKNESAAQEELVMDLRTTTAKRMWSSDLDAFIEAYEVWEAEEAEQMQQLARQQKAVRKGGKVGAKAKAALKKGGKKKAAIDSDEELDDDDDDDIDSFDDDDDFEVAAKGKGKGKASKAPSAGGAAAPRPAPRAATTSGTSGAATTAPRGAAKPAPSVSMGTSSGATAKLTASVSMPAPPAAAAPKPTASETTSGIAVSEPLGLLDRLAGRFQKLNVAKAANSSGSGAASAASVPPASDNEDDAELNDVFDPSEAMSPAPAVVKKAPARRAPATKAASKTKASAAPSKAKADNGATKRKPRGKAVVGSSDDDSDELEVLDSDALSEESDDMFEIDAPSPAVAPKGKRSKTGPSPIHFKKSIAKLPIVEEKASKPAPKPNASGFSAAAKPTAAAAKPAAGKPSKAPAAASKKKAAKEEDSEEELDADGSGSEVEEVEVAPRAVAPRARRAAAAAPTTYVIDDSEDDVEDDDDSDSEFEAEEED